MAVTDWSSMAVWPYLHGVLHRVASQVGGDPRAERCVVQHQLDIGGE